MEKSVIKIGTCVEWSGAWGINSCENVIVEGIRRCKKQGDKEGEEVSEIAWEDKEYGIFDLSNGHWCYGYQIEDIISQPDDEEEIGVRISFRAEVYVNGKSLEEIKSKFEGMALFSVDALEEYGADFIELESVERVDDKSYKEMTTEFEEMLNLC